MNYFKFSRVQAQVELKRWRIVASTGCRAVVTSFYAIARHTQRNYHIRQPPRVPSNNRLNGGRCHAARKIAKTNVFSPEVWTKRRHFGFVTCWKGSLWYRNRANRSAPTLLPLYLYFFISWLSSYEVCWGIIFSYRKQDTLKRTFFIIRNCPPMLVRFLEKVRDHVHQSFWD